ncbi:MAG: MBL fold metallo-hydrolase [Desulfobacterales bacterium]|nr:MBL fold metallo-hydrolase [Desulfobacterales bacterium]MBF0395840.1 MBL fold metallo-hydrolase [Desulfobacterales bacterium]
MRYIKYLAILLNCFAIVSILCAADIKDSESASHGMDSAFHSISGTYSFPGFKVIQFNLPVLSVYSYLLISDGEALMVDPVRDISTYLDTAKKENITIKGVYLTHSHADFVAGHTEMVNSLKCQIYQSKKSGAEYKIEPLEDGSTLKIGKALIKFIDTPGHTPDGMCALVYAKDKPDVPEMMFTGDVLFVGSVGRPDLMGGATSAAWLASAMFDSWTKKLSKLNDSVKFFPAHGAGSLCGAHLSDEPFSTIGKEKVSNSYFKYTKRNEFIAALLEGLPEAPQYFKHNAKLNQSGPPLIEWNAPIQEEVQPNMNLTDIKKYYVLDLRDAKLYAESHIPNSVNIGLRGRLETWTGIMVPWDSELVICGNSQELKEALFRLNRVGYKAGIITLESWKKANLKLISGEPISPMELYTSMEKGEAPVIVDVRLPAEWTALRIGSVLNLPLNHLAELSIQLDSAEPVVTVCNSAYRSSMAAGILERQGFKKPRNLEGGSDAWIKAGFPMFEAAKATKDIAAISTPQKLVKLPERISASELKHLLMDLPGTFEIADIRPAEYFKDYSLPGSKNIDIADLIDNPVYLAGTIPLIIVDRDGSIAMILAGILSQKTQRQIKVLYGGLESYWSESLEKIGTIPTLPKSTSPLLQAPIPKVQEPIPDIKPQLPKKKSAGC